MGLLSFRSVSTRIHNVAGDLIGIGESVPYIVNSKVIIAETVAVCVLSMGSIPH